MAIKPSPVTVGVSEKVLKSGFGVSQATNMLGTEAKDSSCGFEHAVVTYYGLLLFTLHHAVHSHVQSLFLPQVSVMTMVIVKVRLGLWKRIQIHLEWIIHLFRHHLSVHKRILHARVPCRIFVFVDVANIFGSVRLAL